MIKKAVAFAALLALLSLPAAGQIVIKLGTVAPENSPWHEALLRSYRGYTSI